MATKDFTGADLMSALLLSYLGFRQTIKGFKCDLQILELTLGNTGKLHGKNLHITYSNTVRKDQS